MRKLLLWPFLALIIAGSTAEAATTLCVKPGGGSGCFATITLALAAASAGDTIRVAAGTYVETLLVDKNVTLEGGWNDSFSQRDLTNFVSAIQPAPATTTSVVSISGTFGNTAASTPTLDGLLITGGPGVNHGGGLRINDSNAHIRNCSISGNRGYLFGGGVWVQRGSPTFENCRIENNAVSNPGGAPAPLGGGVMLEDASASFVGCSISLNQIVEAGGAGGGIAVQASSAQTLRISSSRIVGNRTGQVACEGSGGGIAVAAAPSQPGFALRVDQVRFDGNCAQFDGGGIAIDTTGGTAPYTVTNSIFSGNTGGGNGDAIHVSAGSADGIVGNSTFVGIGSGRGIDTNKKLTITNSILRDFGTAISYSGTAGQLTATFDDFYANTANVAAGAGFVLDPSNLQVDPELDATQHLLAGSPMVDAGTRTRGPFRDIDGDPRPAAGPSGRFRFDIGADEVASPEAQLVYDESGDPVDLAVVGPGDPPEDPNITTANNEYIGYSALGADLNGDGKDDFLVSAEDWSNDFNDPARASTGRLFGLFNFGTRRRGALDLYLDTQADLEIRSELMRQHMGSELASGDLNGDGRRDLIIGSFEDDNVGNVTPKVFVLFGGAGLAGVRTVSAAAPADFTLLAPAFDFLAFSAPNALAAGDLDGGGVADLVVGDALADDGANTDAGAVFVIFGRSGLSGSRDLATTPADFTLYGPSANARLGSWSNNQRAGLALGDLNGDGALDLVARSPSAAYVIFGPLPAGVRRLAASPADVSVTGLSEGGVIVSDVTGDGKPDLVLGSGSELRVIPGPFAAGQTLAASSAATLVLTGAGADAWSLAQADVVGDGRPDLIVGSRSDATFGGQAFVVSGGVMATGTVPIDEIASLAVMCGSGNSFKVAVASGDFDSDGKADLIVTDRVIGPYKDHGDMNANDAGRAYVIYGGGPVDNCPAVSNPGQSDGDADGAGDACDDCPFYASPNFADTDHDGRGDVCECSDQTGDGRNDVRDLVAINLAIFNPSLVTPLCDGNDDGRCDVRDIIAANTEIFSPGNTSTCARQPVPGP